MGAVCPGCCACDTQHRARRRRQPPASFPTASAQRGPARPHPKRSPCLGALCPRRRRVRRGFCLRLGLGLGRCLCYFAAARIGRFRHFAGSRVRVSARSVAGGFKFAKKHRALGAHACGKPEMGPRGAASRRPASQWNGALPPRVLLARYGKLCNIFLICLFLYARACACAASLVTGWHLAPPASCKGPPGRCSLQPRCAQACASWTFSRLTGSSYAGDRLGQIEDERAKHFQLSRIATGSLSVT